MDSKPTDKAPKKLKFVPKAPTLRPRRPVVPKSEVADGADSFEAKELMHRFNDGLAGWPKYEKKTAPVRVDFGLGSSSTVTYNYCNPFKPSSSRNQDGANPFGLKPEKEYEDPWDYESYYPATLPLRKPYGGNPEPLAMGDADSLAAKLEAFMEQMTARQGALEEQMALLTVSILEKGKGSSLGNDAELEKAKGSDSGQNITDGQNSGIHPSGGSSGLHSGDQNLFTAGLKEEIRIDIEMQQPDNLGIDKNMARALERKQQVSPGPVTSLSNINGTSDPGASVEFVDQEFELEDEEGSDDMDDEEWIILDD